MLAGDRSEVEEGWEQAGQASSSRSGRGRGRGPAASHNQQQRQERPNAWGQAVPSQPAEVRYQATSMHACLCAIARCACRDEFGLAADCRPQALTWLVSCICDAWCSAPPWQHDLGIDLYCQVLPRLTHLMVSLVDATEHTAVALAGLRKIAAARGDVHDSGCHFGEHGSSCKPWLNM